MSTAEWDGDGLVVLADQVRELGGTERVLATLLARYPRATLLAGDFTTTNVAPESSHPLLDRARLVPLGRERRHFLAPLYARRFSRVKLPPADVYLLFSHAGWSGGVRTPAGVPRVGYIAGPPRFLFGYTREYLADYPRAARPLICLTLPLLRRHASRLVARCDRLLTHSEASRTALSDAQGFDADVVYPPVRTDFFRPAAVPKRHVLTVGRVVGHKHLADVVDALSGTRRQLVVAGGGAGLQRLRERAAPNVRFTGFVDDEELRALYQASSVLVCPSVEEFGIVMAEALACGVPVIAPRAGGALEIVEDGRTGVLLDRVDPESIRAAVERIDALEIDPAVCRESALRFSEERYAAEIAVLLEQERARSLGADERFELDERLLGQQLARAAAGS